MTVTATAHAISDLRSACCQGTFYRSLSREESSAIANLHIEANGDSSNAYVEVIYQSNPERAYGFWATPGTAAHLVWVIASPDLLGLSLGREIATLIRTGEMIRDTDAQQG